jgi:O-antigen/teichoic acid export membrane protein
VTFPRSSNGHIALNSVLNFGGLLVPLVVGVVSIPYVVKGLGVDSFGILSLCWMLLGYFTLFDLGLGRATTKFIARELQNGSTDRVRGLFWTSFWMNLILGLVGSVIIAGLAPVLSHSVFRIPQNLVEVAGDSFLLLAFSCPAILITTAFRGALEAAQRFEYVNAVAVVSSSLTFLLPVAGLLMGFGVRGIVILLMISKICSGMAYLLLCFKVFPVLKKGVSPDLEDIRRMLPYGGWISVSNLVQPVLAYLDRFLIGATISIAAVSYYSAPFEMVTRISILPASLAMTLFPSFSGVDSGASEEIANLYSRSVKFLLILLAPLVVLLIVFAREILRLWLGVEFAEISVVVMQVLAAGVFLNSLAQIPTVLILGLGRPDIPAKFHLLELLLYVPLVWILVRNFGIAGGAVAWSIRVAIDTLLLFVASGKFVSVRSFLGHGLKRGISVVVILVSAMLLSLVLPVGLAVKLPTVAAIVVAFGIVSWRFVLDPAERDLVTSTARSLAARAGGASS